MQNAPIGQPTPKLEKSASDLTNGWLASIAAALKWGAIKLNFHAMVKRE